METLCLLKDRFGGDNSLYKVNDDSYWIGFNMELGEDKRTMNNFGRESMITLYYALKKELTND